MYLTCQEGEKKEKKNKRPLVTIRPLHITTHQTMWKRTRWRMQGEAERLDLATGWRHKRRLNDADVIHLLKHVAHVLIAFLT